RAQAKALELRADGAVLSPDGAWLARANARTVKLYSITNQPFVVATFLDRMDVKELIFSRDSHLLLTRDDFGTAHFWSVPQGDLICVHETDPNDELEFSPDGQGVISSGRDNEEVRFYQFAKSQLTPGAWLAIGS